MKSAIKMFAHALIYILGDKRLLGLIGALTGLFSIFSISSERFLRYFSEFFLVELKQTPIPITFLLISVILFSFLYLQSGGNESSERVVKTLTEQHHNESLENSNRLTALSSQLATLQDKLDLYEAEKGLSDDQKQKIISDAIAQANEDAIKKIFSNETSKLQDNIKKNLNFERLTASSRQIVERLNREINDLRLRSNINLLIGMSITAGGLYLLWTTVSIIDTSILLKELASQGNESNDKFFKNLILPLVPRILLVIFVEIFAYFFLRLYKSGLSEIKFFQNELTNVESKLISVEFSYITGNQESLAFSLKSLSYTERNFVLEKGQTTVELEKAKSESTLTRNIIKTIPDFFKQDNRLKINFLR